MNRNVLTAFLSADWTFPLPQHAIWFMVATHAPKARKLPLKAKFSAVLPEFLGSENSFGSDDSGDQLRRRDVESRIAGVAAWIGDTAVLAAPRRGDTPRAENL